MHICPIAAGVEHPELAIRKLQSCPKAAQRLDWLRAVRKPFFFQLLAQAPPKDRKYYFRSADVRDVLKNYVKTCFEFQNETFKKKSILN